MIDRKSDTWTFICDECGKIEQRIEYAQGRASRTPPFPKGWTTIFSTRRNTKRYSEVCGKCYDDAVNEQRSGI